MLSFDFRHLEKQYLSVYRISWSLVLLPICIGPTVLMTGLMDLSWPMAALAYLTLWLLLFVLMLWYSSYWFKAYQYSLLDAGLRIHKGVFWQQQQMVPRNRVQHIDITTGPLERRFGLSKLVVHTAGSRNASVTLPGLLQQNAADLRQELINTNQTEDTV